MPAEGPGDGDAGGRELAGDTDGAEGTATAEAVAAAPGTRGVCTGVVGPVGAVGIALAPAGRWRTGRSGNRPAGRMRRGWLEHSRGKQDPAGDHGQGRRPGAGRQRPGRRGAGRVRRIDRQGETGPAERTGAADHAGPVGRRDRAGVGGQVEQLAAQPGRGDRGGKHAEQHRRVQLVPPVLPAVLAVPGVPVDPLAQQGIQLAAPAGRDAGQLGAGLLPGAGGQERSQRGLEPRPRPRHQDLRLAHAHAEDVGQLPPFEVVAQVQLDDLPVTGVQPGERRAHDRAQFRRLGARAQVGRVVDRFARGAGRDRQCAGTETAAAFVAGHGIEPGPEPARLTEPAQGAGGDDERVLDRVAGTRPAPSRLRQ